MAYTLISLLGTGMYKYANPKDPFEGYVKTNYIFSDGKNFETSLFFQSLLECKYRDINQIIIVGTETSSWDGLIDKDNEERDEVLELWDSLFDECEHKDRSIKLDGISQENVVKLEKYLSERFTLPVSIKLHTSNVNEDTIQDVFNVYTSVSSSVRKENDILFDITHAFRSMPVLLYQALQYSVSNESGKKVELVYGEFDPVVKNKGYVRNLEKYWELSKLSDAMNLFESKLDGIKLSGMIRDIWPKGSKVIEKLSLIVQTNFSIQIMDIFPQIKNAISAYPEKDSEWLLPVKQLMERILRVENRSVARTLYNFSQLLYEKHLNVQAVITLQTCVECAVKEKMLPEGIDYGDYDWWQNIGKNYLRKIKNEDWKGVGCKLVNLEAFRNQIAHGGGKNKLQGYPNPANIHNIYESGIKGVSELLKIFGI